MDDGLIFALINNAAKQSGADPAIIRSAVEAYLEGHPAATRDVQVNGVSVLDAGGIAKIVCLTENKAMRRSYNRFVLDEAQDKKGISATTGAVTSNSSYWITGKVPINGPFVLSRQPYNVYFYGSSDTLIHKTTGTEMYGVQVPPAECSYIRAAFQKSSVAFEDAYTLGIFDLNSIEGFKLTYESPFEVKPLCVTETVAANKAYSCFNDGSGRNVIISAKVKGHGTIAFRYSYPHRTTSGNKGLYTSMVYPIHVDGAPEVHEWRVPPFPDGCTRMIIDVTVDSGAQLDFVWLKSRFDDTVRHDVIKRHCHFGVYSNLMTVQDAEDAAKVGFDSFIMCPKLTSDGVFVSFHDDTAIGNAFREENGDPLTSDEQKLPISGYTYTRLAGLDYGSAVSPYFKGHRIAKLEQLFDVCMKTGLKPMFSVHGLPEFNSTSTSGETWGRIKDMLVSRGLLSRMQIKAGSAAELDKAHAVLGDGIDSYVLDWNKSGDAVAEVKSLSWFDPRIVKIEFFEGYGTAASIKAALDEGITVSSAESSRSIDRMRELIKWGVKEFTEDTFFSMGLNY